MAFLVNRLFQKPVAKLFPKQILKSNENRRRQVQTRVMDVIKTMPVFQFTGDKTKPRSSVYLWGNCITGAIGHRKFVKPERGKPATTRRSPFRLPFAEKHRVLHVACGYGFTVFSIDPSSTSHDFKVFGTGLNTDSQIGYHCARKDHPLVVLSEPVPIELPLKQKSTKILKVSCGRAHTAILTEEGVFTLGNNSFGQCGRPVVLDEVYQGGNKIHKIEGISDEIVDVICGFDHTLFLTKSGEVYSAGWSADGQTGQGHDKHEGIPKVLTGDVKGERIVQVSGSADSVLAVSDKGDLFGWGNSEYGQFGTITDEEQVSVARNIPLSSFNMGKIKSAACGGTMCGVVNTTGDIFVWGFGILGKGPGVLQLKVPTLLPRTLFGLNEFAPDVEASEIFCGTSYFAVITNKGDLYTWGRNKEGCLGLGHVNDQYFPFRVSLSTGVTMVSCGVDHMAVLCKSNF